MKKLAETESPDRSRSSSAASIRRSRRSSPSSRTGCACADRSGRRSDSRTPGSRPAAHSAPSSSIPALGLRRRNASRSCSPYRSARPGSGSSTGTATRRPARRSARRARDLASGGACTCPRTRRRRSRRHSCGWARVSIARCSDDPTWLTSLSSWLAGRDCDFLKRRSSRTVPCYRKRAIGSGRTFPLRRIAEPPVTPSEKVLRSLSAAAFRRALGSAPISASWDDLTVCLWEASDLEQYDLPATDELIVNLHTAGAPVRTRLASGWSAETPPGRVHVMPPGMPTTWRSRPGARFRLHPFPLEPNRRRHGRRPTSSALDRKAGLSIRRPRSARRGHRVSSRTRSARSRRASVALRGSSR